MEGNKYQVTHEHYQGEVVLEYRADGVLKKAECGIDQWTSLQVGWLLKQLATESTIMNKAQMDTWKLKVYSLNAVIDFDAFYKRYPVKRDKKKAEVVWNKMKESEQVKAFHYVQRYLNTLPPRTEAKYPGTYLNSEVWND